MKKIKMKKRFGLNRQKSRGIVDNVLSGTKAGFKAILNFEHAIERKKMDQQKSKSTFSAILLSLILMVTAFWVNPAAAQKYVTDPTTGEVVIAPQYGGTLTMSGYPGATSETMDPYFGWSTPSLGVVEKLGVANWGIDRDEFDHKSAFTPVSFLIGRLAESWDISPDGLTYTFHIRKGVHWHNKPPMNGRELTADDVEYNFHRMLGLGSGFTEPTPFGAAAPLVSIPFESITATDDSTVVMKLKEPHLPALSEILFGHWVYIMPPEVIEEHGDVQDWRNLVGTGPWMLTDLVDGSSLTYVKNPDYWGYDEKYPQNRLPYVDELRVTIMAEEATNMAAIRSGKLDFRRWVISLDSVVSLQRTNPEIAVHPIWFRSSDSFAPNHRVPPFDDINVRRAMQLALDNENVAAAYWKGYADATPHGLVGTKGYYIPFDEWPEEVKQYYRYDPAGAEKLLDEAGYPRGADGTRFKTVLHHPTPTASLDYAEIAASYWAEIGVDVEIDSLAVAEYNERVFSRTYEGMVGAIAAATYAPVLMVSWYHSDDMWNRGGSQWPEMDAMVDAALAATTIEEQKRLIAEVDMYAIEKHWLIWAPKSPAYMLAQPWLIGYNGELDLGLNEKWTTLFARLWIDSELKEAMGH